MIGIAGFGWPAAAAAGGLGGRAAAAAVGGTRARPPAVPEGGGARFESNFGCKVLVPPGPLNETSRGVMFSIRQPLTFSPSVRVSGLAPFTAKIAIRRPGSVTIPVSRVSVSSALGAASPAALCGGRRVLLNRGRASVAASSSSSLGFCCRRIAGASSGCAKTSATAASPVLAGSSSTRIIEPKTKHPAISRISKRRSVTAWLQQSFRCRGSRRHRAPRRAPRPRPRPAAAARRECVDCRSPMAVLPPRAWRGISPESQMGH